MDVLEILRVSSGDSRFDRSLQDLLDRPSEVDDEIRESASEIVDKVREQGDRALLELTRTLDHVEAETVADLRIPKADLERALGTLDQTLRRAMEEAGSRIRAYHQQQLQSSWDYLEEDGTRLGQKVTALDRVGIYVPGGKAAYPSSVLMNAIPARIAGVGEVHMTVPTPRGEVNKAVLAAAELAGVDSVFRVGGAQAVAALAYGTETVPAVDKIVGPGNAYVAAAKKIVFGRVGIDMIAGPSEVVVLADGSVDPEWVAMDLLAQAEHDELAQAIAISTDATVLDRVYDALHVLLPSLERAGIARNALAGQGALIQVADLTEAAQLINRIAPEHLELLIEDPARIIDSIRHAGAIFVGRYSAEALGDYCAGPNHVLPTSGTARFSSPLGVYDFQKRTSIIHCSRSGAEELAGIASALARAESLTAHARSAEYRAKS